MTTRAQLLRQQHYRSETGQILPVSSIPTTIHQKLKTKQPKQQRQQRKRFQLQWEVCSRPKTECSPIPATWHMYRYIFVGQPSIETPEQLDQRLRHEHAMKYL